MEPAVLKILEMDAQTVCVEGECSEYVIRDEGKGIAPEDLPHLFERFYRGKQNSTESVGIGLSLAQKIIVQQNGTIQVKNAPDRGAIFTIRFYKTVV